MLETLIVLVIWLVVVGFVAWILLILIERVPMEDTVKQITKGGVIVVAVLIVLYLLIRVLPALPPLP